MSNKAKKTKIVNIRVTDEEKLNWELFAHACGTNTSGLARYLLNKYSTSYADDKQSRQKKEFQFQFLLFRRKGLRGEMGFGISDESHPAPSAKFIRDFYPFRN